jgi:hypothetical protein
MQNNVFYFHFPVTSAFSVFLLMYTYVILFICVTNDILREISKPQQSVENPQKLYRNI